MNRNPTTHQQADENRGEVDEQVQSVLHVVHLACVCLLDDHLRQSHSDLLPRTLPGRAGRSSSVVIMASEHATAGGGEAHLCIEQNVAQEDEEAACQQILIVGHSLIGGLHPHLKRELTRELKLKDTCQESLKTSRTHHRARRHRRSRHLPPSGRRRARSPGA